MVVCLFCFILFCFFGKGGGVVACVSRFALFFLLKVEGVAVCLSCFDFGKGGGVVVCFVSFLFLFLFLFFGKGGKGWMFVYFV